MSKLPERMRHIVAREAGPPDVLTIAEGEVPSPKAGEVLIRVAWAGVNRPDVLQRAGGYPPPPGASPIIGLEVAGTIAAMGEGVEGWRVGDAVCALTPGGGYAEYCIAPSGHCLPPPPGLALREAAAIPENAFTVWHNVFERGKLVANETLLVHGGSSGIGYTTIQMAKAFGATVITTAGGAEKVAFCKAMGADHAIDYRAADFVAEVATITGKKGVEVVLDMVGGDYIARNLRCLALEGRMVIIAFLHGSKAEIDFMAIMLKRLTVTGSTMRASPVARKTGIASSLRERVWPLYGDGRMKVVIHREFPLAQAGEAHALMESSAHVGKIVLSVAGG